MATQSWRSRRGFTLVEALISTSLLAICGSALLLGLSTALATTDMALEQTTAAGMAAQLMDEIAGKRYAAPGAGGREFPFGPSAYEQSGTGRERFDDIDDYNGYTANPAKDAWGKNLGTGNEAGGSRNANMQTGDYFDRWRQEVSVYYVSAADHSVRLAAGQTSDHRAVEVRVLYDDPLDGLRTVTTLRRVFTYVPIP